VENGPFLTQKWGLFRRISGVDFSPGKGKKILLGSDLKMLFSWSKSLFLTPRNELK